MSCCEKDNKQIASFNIELAVGVGYEFVIVPSNLVRDIWLKKTDQIVSVNGKSYPLYKGSEYDDSTKIDTIMDSPNHPQIYKIDECLVK